MVERDSWNKFFMKVAYTIATRSTCIRRAVGAVAVKDNHILATGYNGAPSKITHCLDIGCSKKNAPSGEGERFCRGTHAEMNCVAQAARYGIVLEGATIYLTNRPCLSCFKTLINVGIDKIIYNDEYPVNDRIYDQIACETRVKIIRVEK